MANKLSENTSAGVTTVSKRVTLAANEPLESSISGAITTEGYYGRTPNLFKSLTNFSLEFYFKYFRDDGETHHNYLFVTDSTSSTGVQLIIRSSSNQMVINIQGVTKDLFYLEPETWYHMVITKSDNTYVCYRDGVKVVTHTGNPLTHGSNYYVLGNYSSINYNLYSFDGHISVCRCFNRALTQDGVTTLYNGGKLPINLPSSLLGICNFSYTPSGVSESGWVDDTGNGYNMPEHYNPQVAYRVGETDGYVRIPFPWGGTTGDNLYLYMKPPGFTQTCYIGSDENTLTSVRKKTLTFETTVPGLSSAAQAVAELSVVQEEASYTYDFVVTPSVQQIAAKGGTSILTATLKTYRNETLVSTQTVTPTYSGSATGFTLSGGTITAANRTTIVGSQRSIEVTAKFTTKEGFAVQDVVTVTQQANAKTLSSIDVTAPAGEIPASGGSKTLTTKANYTYTSTSTSSTTVTPTYSGSATGFSISGAVVTAANRTTTVGSARSITVTSSYTESSVTKTDTVVITQQANATTTITYGDITISSFTVADIPASGGTISSGTVAYSQSRTQNYTSGSTSALSALTTGANITYSTAVTASSKGTTVSGRTDTNKDLTVTVAMNGKTASKAVSVFQAANSATYGGVTITGGNAEDIPASGGTISSLSDTAASQTVSFTSGSTRPGTVTIAYSAPVTIPSKGITISNRGATGKTMTVTATGEGGKTNSRTVNIYQCGNFVTSLAVTKPGKVTYTQIPAKGGTSTPGWVHYGITFTYSSGSTSTQAPATTYGTGKVEISYSWPGASGNFTALNSSTGAVTASSKGTTISNVTTSPVITRTVKYTFTPSEDYNAAGTKTNTGTSTQTVTQAGNFVTGIGITDTGELDYTAIPASGGTSTPTWNYGAVQYTYTSESIGTTKPSSTYGNLTNTKSFEWSNTPNSLFTGLNTSTGTVTGKNRGIIAGTATSSSVTGTIKFTWTPTTTYQGPGTVVSSNYTAKGSITISANIETLASITVTAVPSSGSGSITAMPYTGGNITFNVIANYTYSSGSTDDIDVTGSGATTYYVITNPGGYSQYKATGIWAVNDQLDSRTAKIQVGFNNQKFKTISTTQLSNTNLVVASYGDVLSSYGNVKAGY